MDIEHRQACEERLKVREFGVCSLEATMRILSASTDSLKAIFRWFSETLRSAPEAIVGRILIYILEYGNIG
jgi:hypothetical protein